ncbi:MAG: leucine-rich repeat protein [Muribaculaceae bacterium]|nr:leucine-rich repeat protein [Muribaculaceae bacterium]
MKKLYKLIFSLLLVLVPTLSFAEEFVVGDIKYEILWDSNSWDTPIGVGVSGASKEYLSEITIPSAVSPDGVINYEVLEILPSAFQEYSTLKKIVLPSTLKYIRSNAFSGCFLLSSVTLPESLISLEYCCFSGCTSLKEITIPAFVTQFDFSAFIGCTSMIGIDVDPANPEYSSFDGIVYDKSGEKLYTCPHGKTSVTFLEYVKEICSEAFRDCIIEGDLMIPPSVEKIGHYAFGGCSRLEYVEMGDKTIDLEDQVFYMCSAKRVKLSNKLKVLPNNTFAWSGLENIELPETLEVIGSWVFQECKLTNLLIPDNVTVIGEGTFDHCSIESLVLPPKLDYVSAGLFRDSQLKEIFLPASIKIIASEAFQRSLITEVTLPKNLENIYKDAFNACQELKVIYSEKATPPTAYLSFDEREYQETTLIVPEGSENKYKTTDPWKNFAFIHESNYIGLQKVTIQAPSKILGVGETMQLNADIEPFNASDPVVTWEVIENESCVEIDSEGLLTAKEAGRTRIKVIAQNSLGYSEDEMELFVGEIKIENIPDQPIIVGEEYQLGKTLNPEEIGGENVVWISSDENVATVNSEGVVTANGAGITEITVYLQDYPEIFSTCEITVDNVQVEWINIINPISDLTVGDSYQFEIEIYPENAFYDSLKWSSSDENVATVNSEGVVTAIGAGTTEITVYVNDYPDVFATCEITVDNVHVEWINIVNPISELKIGESYQFELEIYPEEAVYDSLTWSSSNDNVAIVDQTGLVKGISEGYVFINVYCDDKWTTCGFSVVEDAGVEGLISNPENKVTIYSIDGVLIKKDCKIEDLKRLEKGVYIISSGKERYKVSI